MYNFTYNVPTKIHFGKGQISHLDELRASGTKVLLVYGGGSIKKVGIHAAAMQILTDAGLKVVELSGVEPNPRIESVRKGVDLCRRDGIDMVLAIGGGSVIDCAKVIAAGARYDGDAWDLVLDPQRITAALPLYAVLTLAATGSEMDGMAVISDLGKNEKWATGCDLLRPTMSILDPEYTFSVSQRQTSSGTADIMSHIFENYFTPIAGADVQARFAEGLLKTVIKYGPVALAQPENYDARANLMWASSMAINGLLIQGAAVDWCVHPMEHELSAFYDITHGEGLAILTPHWMRHVLSAETAGRFAEYARNVWDVRESDDMVAAKEGIARTAAFFQAMHLPQTLRAVGIANEEKFDVMADKAAKGCKNAYVPLSAADVRKIFEAAL